MLDSRLRRTEATRNSDYCGKQEKKMEGTECDYSKLIEKRGTEQGIQFRRRYKGKTEEVGPRWRLGKTG
jgi:hypothetical protein